MTHMTWIASHFTNSAPVVSVGANDLDGVGAKDEDEEVIDSSKLYKVQYTVNMLPTLSEFIV